jgi:hypothetical protein
MLFLLVHLFFYFVDFGWRHLFHLGNGYIPSKLTVIHLLSDDSQIRLTILFPFLVFLGLKLLMVDRTYVNLSSEILRKVPVCLVLIPENLVTQNLFPPHPSFRIDDKNLLEKLLCLFAWSNTQILVIFE